MEQRLPLESPNHSSFPSLESPSDDSYSRGFYTPSSSSNDLTGNGHEQRPSSYSYRDTDPLVASSRPGNIRSPTSQRRPGHTRGVSFSSTTSPPLSPKVPLFKT